MNRLVARSDEELRRRRCPLRARGRRQWGGFVARFSRAEDRQYLLILAVDEEIKRNRTVFESTQ
jgi:hypothetical protein